MVRWEWKQKGSQHREGESPKKEVMLSKQAKSKLKPTQDISWNARQTLATDPWVLPLPAWFWVMAKAGPLGLGSSPSWRCPWQRHHRLYFLCWKWKILITISSHGLPPWQTLAFLIYSSTEAWPPFFPHSSFRCPFMSLVQRPRTCQSHPNQMTGGFWGRWLLSGGISLSSSSLKLVLSQTKPNSLVRALGNASKSLSACLETGLERRSWFRGVTANTYLSWISSFLVQL